MPEITASDLMDTRVTTLGADTEIHRAMQMLLRKKLSGAPVVDDDDRVVGILSEKDCLKVVTASAFERLPEGRVRDYMTEEVVTLTPKATVYDIVDRFLKSAYRRLPVVSEDGALLGVVSRTNVVKAIASMRENPKLYGTPDPEGATEEESPGVDSAMRRARGC